MTKLMIGPEKITRKSLVSLSHSTVTTQYHMKWSSSRL